MRLARLGSRISRHLVTFLFLLGFLFISCKISAQEGGLLPGETLQQNPKDREVTVTAIVPVQDPPPVPILIEPEDEALLNSGAITFRWRLQTHLIPYTKQELIVNGETLFSNLPLGNFETDEYRLRYEDGIYSLQLKSGHHLADGDYTWRVRVYDTNNRSTGSTTWIFTIDSKAPQLLVTKIDQQETAISSYDATTVPEEPFVVRTRTPTVSGKTEANAEVQLLVVFPDGRTQLLTTTADSSGNFSFVLPVLNRGELVELRFSAIDEAGNTSALSGIFVIYEPPLLEFPLLPPFLLPQVPLVTIPLDLPVITIPEIPVPPGFEEPVAEIMTFWDITRNFLMEMLPFLPWIGVFFFLLYLVSLFWLTGATLGFFWLFVWGFARAWIVGWKRDPHQWKELETGKLLPGFSFQIQRTSERESNLKKRRVITTIFGEWSVEPRVEWMHALLLPNRHWIYPVGTRFSESWNEPRELWLAGESFTWKDTQKEWKTSAECFVLPADFTEFRFVAWARRMPGSSAVWFRFVPRVWLLLALICSAVVVLLAPNVLSLLIFVFVLWVLFRDIVWNVPELWRVYVESKNRQ